ncbi:MAG TPA: helix-turn-helix domain-containing protein, partial [Geobacteraceae bacterium]|nr:helix-turn-helix domain-containing protein [Geobacteraceae bacterium]
LYYRLNVFPIDMPPLRERREDIPVLTKFYLARYNKTFSRNFQEISPAALELMESYDWPGNIRELKNVIERICIMHGGPVLMPDYLPRELNLRERRDDAAVGVTTEEMELGLEGATERYEKTLIQAALAGTGGNVLQAAQLLKVPRGTLRYKMAKYGL